LDTHGLLLHDFVAGAGVQPLVAVKLGYTTDANPDPLSLAASLSLKPPPAFPL